MERSSAVCLRKDFSVETNCFHLPSAGSVMYLANSPSLFFFQEKTNKQTTRRIPDATTKIQLKAAAKCIIEKITLFQVWHEQMLLWLLWQLTCKAQWHSSYFQAAGTWHGPSISPKKQSWGDVQNGRMLLLSWQCRETYLIALEPSRPYVPEGSSHK